MRLKAFVKKLLRHYRLDVQRYSAQRDEGARVVRLLQLLGSELVLDVGANSGAYGRMLREHGYRGRIISFEPLPDAYDSLCSLAATDPAWQVAPRCGIGRERGRRRLNVSKRSTSSSFLEMTAQHISAAPDSHYAGTVEADLWSLDEILDEMGLDAHGQFLKLDVQGYEMEALLGAAKTLKKVVGLELEVSHKELYQHQPLFPSVLAEVLAAGFETYDLAPGLRCPKTWRLLQSNAIFVRAGALDQVALQ